ncbi:uncharacterized protein LOC134182606 [Corticium candelabrum]|uniref:uncharacterized protein LOC134182606 n=1 Tax=Corticium candelabrum TaxID=121492 RepID=UPI002E25DB14|nr:uncharacterized protein LOC134182606 [Corticium candelabrum]
MQVNRFVFLLLSYAALSSTADDGFYPQETATFALNASTDELTRADVLARFSQPTDRLTSSLKFRYETLKGKPIYVFDRLFAWDLLYLLQIYVSVGGWWRFVNDDPYHTTREKVGDNIQWMARFSATTFANSRIGVTLRQAVQLTAGRPDVAYYPYEITCKMVRRGDDTRLHVHANASDDEYTTVVYLNYKWRKNDYGDMLLFDEEEEIVAPVKPVFGRVIVWHSSVPYLSRPPSVAFRMGQKILFIRWTSNSSKVVEYENRRLVDVERIAKGQKEGFALRDEPPESAGELNIGDYETARFATREGRKIFVFDDLFNRTELDVVRSYIIDYGKYYYDDSLDRDSDNVQWISGYEIDAFVGTKYWGVVRQIANYVSGGSGDWFPYDVSCNLIRATDYTRIHLDCDKISNEWTFLLYLNPNWGENDYGETAFFETEDDDTELVTEIRPRYGRVTIFEGAIPHSARPPSTAFTGGRYSLAVKVASSKFRARVNTLREKTQHEVQLKVVGRFMTILEQGKFTDGVRTFFQNKILGALSEKELSDLEKGIEPEEESKKDRDEDEDRDDDDDDDGNAEQEFGVKPGDDSTPNEITDEEQQYIDFLEGDDEDYHVSIERMAYNLEGNLEAIEDKMVEFSQSYTDLSNDLKRRMEALL